MSGYAAEARRLVDEVVGLRSSGWRRCTPHDAGHAESIESDGTGVHGSGGDDYSAGHPSKGHAECPLIEPKRIAKRKCREKGERKFGGGRIPNAPAVECIHARCADALRELHLTRDLQYGGRWKPSEAYGSAKRKWDILGYGTPDVSENAGQGSVRTESEP